MTAPTSRRHFGALMLSAAALAAPRGAGAQASSAPGAPRDLVIGMSGHPPALDPVLFNHTATRRVVPQIFDTLLAVDYAHGRGLRPALAEHAERVDERTLRVHLRRGVTFHDGSPFTAQDVAFSLGPDHLLGPGRSGNVVSQATLGRLERVDVVDDASVTVTAKGPDALLEQRLACWASQIVSKRAFEAAGSWDRWLAAPVGTGPYRFVDQQTDVRVRLRANAAYWGGPPPYASLEYRIVPEVGSRLAGLFAGDLHVVTDVPPDQFAVVARRPELAIVGGDVQNIRLLMFDCTDPVLRDARVRRAMSLALDRRLIVDSLWDGRISIPNGFQMASFGPSYIADFPAPAHDPEAARALLRAAGYSGQPIAYKALNNYYTLQIATAQAMIEMWRAVGLNVQLQILENLTQVLRRPIDALFDASASADLPDHLGQAWRLFGPSSQYANGLGLWRNDEYARLGGVLEQSVDARERSDAHRRMLEILANDDPPGLVLHMSGQFYAKRRDVAWQPVDTLDMDFGPFATG
jgi:peptide/nickel transport system substrate-binding protein